MKTKICSYSNYRKKYSNFKVIFKITVIKERYRWKIHEFDRSNIEFLKYTASGLTKVILIGVLFVILDQIDELSWIGPYATLVEYVLVILSFVLGFLAAGYIFRIIE